jgi:hypothetical protein
MIEKKVKAPDWEAMRRVIEANCFCNQMIKKITPGASVSFQCPEHGRVVLDTRTLK